MRGARRRMRGSRGESRTCVWLTCYKEPIVDSNSIDVGISKDESGGLADGDATKHEGGINGA